MIRLLLTTLYFSNALAKGRNPLMGVIVEVESLLRSYPDRLRKISGDAAPEKAQEPIEEYEDFVHTIDSSISMDDTIPQPPPLSFSLPVAPTESQEPRPPSSRPVVPQAPSPSPQTTSTLMPPPSTTSSDDNNQATITMTSYDGVQNTVDDTLPEPDDDLEEFRKADLLEKEKKEEVKDLVRKNKTTDFYITSSPSPIDTTSEDRREEEGNDVFDFNRLFDKQSAVVEGEVQNNTTTSTTTIVPKKTCINVSTLKKIDREAAGTKKGTIDVEVEVGEEDSEGDSEEEEEVPVRRARQDKEKEMETKKRQDKKNVVWKKFEMNCDEEEDEKGHICKLWALGGLCTTHRPTMFLFCRKTCLCVGPS